MKGHKCRIKYKGSILPQTCIFLRKLSAVFAQNNQNSAKSRSRLNMVNVTNSDGGTSLRKAEDTNQSKMFTHIICAITLSARPKV
jgi:hypothetical protein